MLYADPWNERSRAVPDPREVTVAVGRNVRAERLRKTWTLDDLAARSGVSKGMLVQVEQARTNPSIATICRLATALGVSMASLVEAPEAPSAQVVRSGEGVPLWRGRTGGLAKLMAGVGTRHQVELWDVRIVAGDAMVSEAHPAGTRELLLVVEGELTLELDGAPYRVGPGDAIAFVADRPHTYRNAGEAELRCAMAVVVQQSPTATGPASATTAQGKGLDLGNPPGPRPSGPSR
jgi:transcriptional regulator with XRE-family HTH domain